MPRASGLLVIALGVLPLAFPGAVRAQPFEEFAAARQAYNDQNFPEAAQRFEALVPRARGALLLETRKYLGATYVFLGQRTSAEEQFEQLLRADPSYPLDPGFAQEVQQVFRQVQHRLEEERHQDEVDQQHDAQEREARLAHQRELLAQLREMASEEIIEERGSRWIAAIPFGIGQFQNGHRGLGIFFALTEGALVATSLVTALVHRGLRDEMPVDIERFRNTELALRLTNQLSLAGFAALGIVGIVDAQLRFRAVKRRTRHRVLPEELQEGAFELSLGPAGVRFGLWF